MDEPFDARRQRHERAVIGEVRHLAGDLRARLELGHFGPRVGPRLLEAQADAPRGGIVLQDHHLDAVAFLHHLARMVDAAPAHLADVQKPVDTAEIDEGAVGGETLHRAFDDGALDDLL